MQEFDFELNTEKLKVLVNKIFMQTSGINKEGKKYERMRNAASAIGDMAAYMFTPEMVCVYTEDVALEGRKVLIEDIAFECTGFEQIAPETVTGAYVYVMTAGNFALPEEAVINQLYADIWGTAYTDGMRLLLKDELERNNRLSDSFGPGFYGMEVAENAKISKLIDLRQLNIEIKENGIMVPLKSCAGIYFTVTEDYIPLNAACADCRGTYSSCRLCQTNGGIQDV